MDQNKHAHWAHHIAQWKESGKNKREYCREHALSYWNFMCWERKTRKDAKSDLPLVKVSSLSTRTENDIYSGIEIRINEKLTVNIGRDYDSPTLKKLLADFEASL